MPHPSITQPTLARRLNLLLDARKVEGRAVEFPVIQRALASTGHSISRPKWAYMRQEASAHRPRGDEILVALAGFFEVPAAYLTDENAPTPDAVRSVLTEIREHREAAVVAFAAQQLQGLSPQALHDIQRALEHTT